MTKIISGPKQQHCIPGIAVAILYCQIQPMIVIIFLLSASLLVALFFLGAYLWSVRSGQFDDDYSPAHRIFFEDARNNNDTAHNHEKH